MGVIRGFFLVVVAVLLFLSILSLNIFWILSSSLEYDNVQQEVPAIVTDFLKDIDATSVIDNNYDLIMAYCTVNPDMNYVFGEGDYTFTISCASALQGKDAMVEDSVKGLVYNIYYADYDCNFFDCMEESTIPFFLISERAHNYWNNKFYLALMASFILLILTFFLIEKKTNLPILVGSFMIISSLPFIKLDYILSIFSDKSFVKILDIFFSQAYPVSLRILILGIIVLIIGIIMKFFKIGFFISNLVSKFKKGDNKKLVVKKKEKQPKKNAQKGKKK